MRPSVQILERRRSIVRSLYYQGVQQSDIIERLEKDQLFPEAKSWSSKKQILRRDIDMIVLADAQRFQGLEIDTERARQEYIARQEGIYAKAMERNDLEVAIRASKDIAKAHGIQTDEPVVKSEGLATIMGRMMNKDRLPAPQKTIDVTPIPEKREPAMLTNQISH